MSKFGLRTFKKGECNKMDDKERQRQEFRNRNERNRKYLKKTKWFYRFFFTLFFGNFGWIIVYKSYSRPWVMYTLLAWILLFLISIVIGALILRCPHCDSYIRGQAYGDICPICGTKIKEYSDL